MESSIAAVVIENPLLDVTVQDPDNVVHTKYELQHGQASLVDEKTMPIHDELQARDDCELTCGGAALNSARAMNHVLRKANHDGKVCFIGCVAKDDAGAVLQKTMEDVGMIPNFAITDEEKTGRCAVVIHGKERTLCANIGASQKYPTKHFDDNLDIFAKANLIYSTGFFITSNIEALKKVCQFAASNDKPMLFNIAAPFLMHIAMDDVKFCIEHADYVFCNEDEGSLYAEKMGLAKDDREAAAKHIAKADKANKNRSRVAIITQGAEKVIIATGKGEEEPELSFVEVPKLEADKIVDTNGAGDAFVGGFMAAMTQGKNVEDSVKAGIEMSAIVVQRLGCQFE